MDIGEFPVDDLPVGIPRRDLLFKYLQLVLHFRVNVPLRVWDHTTWERIADLVAILSIEWLGRAALSRIS